MCEMMTGEDYLEMINGDIVPVLGQLPRYVTDLVSTGRYTSAQDEESHKLVDRAI